MSRFLAPLSPRHRQKHKDSKDTTSTDNTTTNDQYTNLNNPSITSKEPYTSDQPNNIQSVQATSNDVTTDSPQAALISPLIIHVEQPTAPMPKGSLNADVDKPLPPPRMVSDTPQPSRPLSPTSLMAPIQNVITKPLAVLDTAFAPANEDFDDPNAPENYMTTEQLRQEYEDEEVDRFLRVFARQVHEVRMPVDLPPSADRRDRKRPDGLTTDENTISMSPTAADDLKLTPESSDVPLDDDSGEEWRYQLGDSKDPNASSYSVVSPEPQHQNFMQSVQKGFATTYKVAKDNALVLHHFYKEGEWPESTLSEYIARDLIVPILPPPHRKTYHFSFGNMQQITARLYLSVYPIYAPLIQRMWRLATWEDATRSGIFCALYWILWYYNYLIPALLGRLVFELLRRRYLSYPTAKELRERRAALARADVVADALQIRLDTNTSAGLGFRDAWNVFRMVTKGKKRRARVMAETKVTHLDPKPAEKSEAARDEEGEDEDIRRTVLAIMEEVADAHERLVNIGRWRNPDASKRYTTIVVIFTFIIMFIPAQYIAKGIYATLGISFWFLPNIWMAIPLEHRSRIPAPFSDAPTDAEYAMEIIGQRAARGEEVLPNRLRNKRRNKRGTTVPVGTMSTQSLLSDGGKSSSFVDITTGQEIDPDDDNDYSGDGDVSSQGKKKPTMRRVREKAVKGWIWAEEGRRMLKGDGNKLPGYDLGHPEHLIQTYPAQHGAIMGMLTLTPNMLLFTPAMSSKVKIQVPFEDIRSVKKTGRMSGLLVKYIVKVDQTTTDLHDSIIAERSVAGAQGNAIVAGEIGPSTGATAMAANGEPLEKEEKFRWVGGRDEVFARLVGWGGRRWVKM